MEYFYTMSMVIEADSLDEAEAIYEAGYLEILGHTVSIYNKDGIEVELL